MPTRLVTTFAVVLAAAPAAGAQPVDFNRDVRPILSNNCFTCHGPDEKERKGDLRLDTRDGALAAVVPGNPAKSALVERVRSTEPGEVMPPAKSGKKLTPREIDVLDRWVKQGAAYAPHWAYVPPTRPPVPATKHATRSPIDAFLFYRLEREGLSPQPEADRYALLRRAALDLTGLPPTWAEAQAFVQDTADGAFERQVDRLLASPRFGEHWARMWLDLARYADSAGYADDPSRTIWKYRDYVIRAFNDNLPFDRFTVEQLAGDLLPNPTDDQLTATAFNRNTMTNSEGGTNDEEFRNVAVVDRVNTTFTVWMGTSMACAQCHTHKYDPLTQREYFGLFAFFNNTADADRSDESPLQEFWAPGVRERRRRVESEVASLETILKGAKATELKADRDRLGMLKKQLPEIKPLTTVPIMKELPAKQRRVTKLQFRGNFMDLGEVVTEGVPSAFHQLQKARGRSSPGFDRLDLADWIVSPQNPLTARVVANRFWEQLFGTGLVRTSEEFGAQGEQPSHPELLDWLAVELQSDWNVKRFLRLLVTSAAYRQSSRVTPPLVERDPENRLLARGPRVRLSAETVRDQALAAAGLLSAKTLGPSVKPPQPNLGLSAAFGRSIDWQPSTGEDRYRRGVYTEWRRSNPYPSMSTFDAPNRDACTVRRARTNTPLQALVTMNDPVYVEAAQALARRVIRDGGKTRVQQVLYAVQLTLARPATDAEIVRLLKLHRDAFDAFAKDTGRAAQFATNPLGPLPEGVHAVDAAAWTTVASVLLNLDEMFMKR